MSFRRRRHRAALVLAGCGIWLAVGLCSPAAGAVTVGPTNRPDPAASQNINYPPNSAVFNEEDAPGGTQLRSPMNGVVTRWRVHTGDVSAGSSLQLRVMTPLGGNAYAMSASGPAHPVGPMSGSSNPNSFDVRVPILAGQLVAAGIYHPTPGFLEVTLAVDTPAPSPWALGEMTSAPPDGLTGTATVASGATIGADRYIGLSADIEPDADADGFGDETQDACPASAATQGACPAAPPPIPDTLDPAIVLGGRRVMSLRAFLRGPRVSVSSDEPVALRAELLGTVRRATLSAYNLLLASRSAPLAAGPRTLRLRPGRALVGRPRKGFRVRIRVTATDAAGNAARRTRTVRVRRR